MKHLDEEEAVSLLRQGKAIVYPTETFYAVGCDVFNVAALRDIYRIKQRDNCYPLPVIVGGPDQLAMLCEKVSEAEMMLMESFWPGPLSIAFAAGSKVPPLLNACTGKVVVRMSSSPAAGALCLGAGTPLVSSSANISGHPPARGLDELDPRVLEAVEGRVFKGDDDPAGGLPSTIVETLPESGGLVLRILRGGAVSEDALKACGFRIAEPLFASLSRR